MTTRCLQTASTIFFITKDGARIALNFIKSTGDFVKQFKDFIANFSSAEVGRKLAAMSENRRKAFFEDFRGEVGEAASKFDEKPELMDAWDLIHKSPYSHDFDVLNYVEEVKDVATVGIATSTNYSNTFFNAFPNQNWQGTGFVVHHAIE